MSHVCGEIFKSISSNLLSLLKLVPPVSSVGAAHYSIYLNVAGSKVGY